MGSGRVRNRFLSPETPGEGSHVAWGAIGGIVLLGLVPIIIAHLDNAPIYRVRVSVVGIEGTHVEDAKVWSSMGGEPKFAGGWEFDIPGGVRPADGKLIVWASQEAAYLKGNRLVQLDEDHNPAITIQLEIDKSATVRGLVVDRAGRGVAGAKISVTGYEKESVTTQEGGNFLLAAHAARNQNVLVHAEAKNYKGSTQWQPAGDTPAIIVLDRK